MKSKIAVSLFVLSLSHNSVAQVGSSQTGGTTATAAPATTGSINQNANSGKSMQLVGAATNGAMSAMFFSKCPVSTWSCVAGGMTALQAAMMLRGSGSSGRTAAATNYDFTTGTGTVCGTTLCTDTNGDGIVDNPADTTSTFQGAGANDGKLFTAIENQTQGVLTGLKNRGYIVNEGDGSVTTPTGQRISGSSFSTPQSMAALGMTPAEISAMQNDMATFGAAAADRARAVAIETEGGGGGSASVSNGARKTASGSGSGSGGLDLASLFGKKAADDAKKKGLEGLSKKLGTDSIGVASDNMFEMISRQYRKQENAQEFIVPAAAVGIEPAGALKRAIPRKPGAN